MVCKLIMGSICCCGSKTPGSQLKRTNNKFAQRIAYFDKKIQELNNNIELAKRKLMLKPNPQTKKTLLEKIAQDILLEKKYNKARKFARKELANIAQNRLIMEQVQIIKDSNKVNSCTEGALKQAAIDQLKYKQNQQNAQDLRQIMDDIQGMNQQGQEFDQQLKALQAEFADLK